MKFLIILAFAVLPMLASASDAVSQTNTLDQLPAALQAKVKTQVGEGKLGSIEKSFEGGEVVYEIGVTGKDGEDRDFSMSERGTLLSVEIPLVEAPAEVQQAARKLAGDGQVQSIDKVLDDEDVTYDLQVERKDGRVQGFTLADDGTLLGMEVALDETPQNVQAGIKAQVGDGKLQTIGKVIDEEAVSYDVEFTRQDGRNGAFTVGSDGKLVSVQVALEETPAAVQRTIKQRMGDGRILRIDKSFEVEKGVRPFQVRGRKNGKPFDFSVGPKGRFLGMDD